MAEKVFPIVRPRISFSSLPLKEMLGVRIPPVYIRKIYTIYDFIYDSKQNGGEGVSYRPACAFLFPRYSLGKCLAFESHLYTLQKYIKM